MVLDHVVPLADLRSQIRSCIQRPHIAACKADAVRGSTSGSASVHSSNTQTASENHFNWMSWSIRPSGNPPKLHANKVWSVPNPTQVLRKRPPHRHLRPPPCRAIADSLGLPYEVIRNSPHEMQASWNPHMIARWVCTIHCNFTSKPWYTGEHLKNLWNRVRRFILIHTPKIAIQGLDPQLYVP